MTAHFPEWAQNPEPRYVPDAVIRVEDAQAHSDALADKLRAITHRDPADMLNLAGALERLNAAVAAAVAEWEAA